MEQTRKRKLSTESTFLPQLKYYVNENIQNKQSEQKMQEIYNRTMNMLFKGANKATEEVAVEENEKSLEIRSKEKDAKNGGNVPLVICHNCLSPSNVSVKCTNCNLICCERCGIACSGCVDALCHGCVSLFKCGTMERPLCQRCSTF